MGAFTNYMEGKIVDAFLRNTSYASPASVHLALFTAAADGEAGTVTEAAFTGYARQAATWTALDSAGQTKNSALITFPANGNPVDSAIITHVGIYDAATNGNLLLYAALTSSKTLAVGDVLAFAANAVVFTLD